MAEIDWKHDGLEVRLQKLGAWSMFGFWAAISIMGGLAFLMGAFTPVKIAVIPGLIACLAGALMAKRAHRNRRATLICDGRTLTFDDGSTRSLLDLKAVGGKLQRLWFDPELGPLQPFSVGPFRETDEELARVAELLNTAIAQAEHRRGEAPDKLFFKMKQVLGEAD